MALLDRLKVRVETDLTDLELQAMIDETVGEIEARFGANAEIVETLDGNRSFLSLHRLIDETETIVVVEIEPANTGASANETTLASNDYRIRHGGRIVERLTDGTNGRIDGWAPLVRMTYTPISDQIQRDEVVIKVVHLSLTYQGLNKQERAGDHSRGGSVTADAFTKERDILISGLAPRGRLVMA